MIPIETDPAAARVSDGGRAAAEAREGDVQALFASMTCGGGWRACRFSPTRAAEDTRGDRGASVRPHPEARADAVARREPRAPVGEAERSRDASSVHASRSRNIYARASASFDVCWTISRRSRRSRRRTAVSAAIAAFPPRAMPFEDALARYGPRRGDAARAARGRDRRRIVTGRLRTRVAPAPGEASPSYRARDGGGDDARSHRRTRRVRRTGTRKGTRRRRRTRRDGDDFVAEEAENVGEGGARLQIIEAERPPRHSRTADGSFGLARRSTSRKTTRGSRSRVLPGSTSVPPSVDAAAEHCRSSARVRSRAARFAQRLIGGARFVWLVEGPEPRDDRGDDRTGKRARV